MGAATRPATIKTREIRDKLIENGGITPLEVLLDAMQTHWEAGDKEEACRVAAIAAPYCHPRLQAIQAHVQQDLTQMSEKEIDERIKELTITSAKGMVANGEITLADLDLDDSDTLQ